MWYIELICSLCILSVISGSIYFNNLNKEEHIVDCETLRLVSVLQEVQERSRNFHYMSNGDFVPSCRIYKDKYVLIRAVNDEETYYLPNDVKINFYDSADVFVYRQTSLYNKVTNKTLRIYKNNTAKYIIINRVGRIRINKLYAESE